MVISKKQKPTKLTKPKKVAIKRKQVKFKKEKIIPGQLSALEKETIIIFNKEEREAEIFTYEKTWQDHLENKCKIKPISDNGWNGKTYIIDKKVIKLPKVLVKKNK